ncbi:phospholipase D-like domain-containing protein [Brevibacterium sp. ZH18]|uniref:phospholipase D-like domain-containing protein n=1 Tax=Brevibacterium sp. ZH18 TaxID=2927784 RepID=UPI001F618FD7|nr:phospholipase D-like domain-containing protein [Brevibacterium sp. ZH18]MCI4012233.1 phospholipase D-like domain-containing protein [Brevibacterium sp. ZH18]
MGFNPLKKNQGLDRVRRIAPLVAAGAAAMIPATIGASMVVDLLQKRDREQREAPRPGTFHASVEGSDLSIFTDGETLYEDMLDEIGSATESIQMETFIWKNDEMGQKFIDAFNAAAQRGVDIHLIYDGFANLTISRSFYAQLDDRIKVLRLPTVARKFWKGPLRYSGFNHSKILVIDSDVAYVGGFNIGSLYARHWRDTHLKASGPGTWGLRQSISQVWNEYHDDDEQIPWVAPTTWESKIRVSANQPIQLVYPIRSMYLNAFERAQDRIWLTTPYFIPDQQLLKSLIEAAERGVDVRVMVPQESNHILGDSLSRGFFEQMVRSKVTVLLYTASMIHAKIATVDGTWSTVGTANIDRLSLTFNYETNVEVIDSDFAAEMEKTFLADAEHCQELGPDWLDRHQLTQAAEWVLRPMRPFL